MSNNKCWCERKIQTYCVCEKDYIWNPATVVKMVKIIDDSEITCDEIIEEMKTVPTNFS